MGARTAPIVRIWPKTSKYSPSMIPSAFQLPRARAQVFLRSRGVLAAFAASAAWKAKYGTTQSPSVVRIVAENAAPSGRKPVGRLQEYIALLETMVDDTRSYFKLGAHDRIGLPALRDAHRVLCCGHEAVATFAGRPSASTIQPGAPVIQPSAPAISPSEPSGQLRRVDIQANWVNPPAKIPASRAARFLPSIQQNLPSWADFESWIEGQYDLTSERLRPARFRAYTTPSTGPLRRFDLTGMKLTENEWEYSLAAAGRMGLLMVAFKTVKRDRVMGDGGWDGDDDENEDWDKVVVENKVVVEDKVVVVEVEDKVVEDKVEDKEEGVKKEDREEGDRKEYGDGGEDQEVYEDGYEDQEVYGDEQDGHGSGSQKET